MSEFEPFSPEQPLRIAFLSALGELGGAERMLLDVMGSLKAVVPRGSQMYLISATDGPLLERAMGLGVKVSLLPFPEKLATMGESSSGRGLFAMLKLLRIARAVRAYRSQLRERLSWIDPHIIHSNGMKMHLLSGTLQRSGTNVVWHLHDFVRARPMLSRMLRRVCDEVCILAISKAVALDAGLVMPNADVRVVYNAIDTAHFTSHGERADLDQLAGHAAKPAGTPRVGLVATYALWKGQELFLEAARIAIERHGLKDAHFYIIGGPIYQTGGSQYSQAELEDRAVTLGISKHVSFIPFQLDPAPVYRALDLVIHASTRPEPFGRTITEAMSCGRAVIVSNEGGAAEIITDGLDALGFRARDAEALAGAMARLVENADERARLGTAARETALVRFALDRLGSDILRIYRSLTS